MLAIPVLIRKLGQEDYDLQIKTNLELSIWLSAQR